LSFVVFANTRDRLTSRANRPTINGFNTLKRADWESNRYDLWAVVQSVIRL